MRYRFLLVEDDDTNLTGGFTDERRGRDYRERSEKRKEKKLKIEKKYFLSFADMWVENLLNNRSPNSLSKDR